MDSLHTDGVYYLGFIPHVKGLPPVVMWFMIILILAHLAVFGCYLLCLTKSLATDPARAQRIRMENKLKGE